jgi:mannose-1-phosphate guanylyltransferase
VILAGGAGTRFWPVSTPDRPKQLLPLGQGPSLIGDTVERLLPLVGTDRLRILTGQHLAGPLLHQTGLAETQLMVEPEAKGTAPVLAWAAHTIVQRDPGAVMASLHSDHVIRPAAEFRKQLQQAADLARAQERLLTFGVPPTRPETGYGYIRAGKRLGDDDPEVYEVAQFVEKPTRETAGDFVRRGYLWNSGIFVWPAQLFLDELRQTAPRLGALLPLLDQGRTDEFFAQAPILSVDEGVLEKSKRVAVLPTHFEWDDVGAWDAVGRTRPADGDGNVTIGQTALVDARNCIAWSEDGTVVLFGVEDLVVVRTGEVTLVAARDRTPELKSLLKQLPRNLRDLSANE